MLVKDRRLDLGLNRPAFVAEMAKHGQDITPDYLNKLERGTAPLSRASLEVREAIRAVLGYSVEEWRDLTGLYTPDIPEPLNTIVQRPGRINRQAVPPPVEIPEGLLEAGERFAIIDPLIAHPKVQGMLAQQGNFGGRGPVTAEEWWRYFESVRQYIEVDG
ncbi:transcriptional regulator [Deinococcus phoenicis]|uniref:transcriptional regulator n=1 Tax=Deinococcus phoenicis TaxID=1476583 RepID=UPI00054EE0EF|nr:transcriptional regulator [Deinococcus phoenicis]